MSDIIKQQNQVEVFDTKKITEYLESQGLLQIPDKYKVQFIELAKAYQLNPFKREIYAVGYGGNFSIITGYEVYLKRAEDSGLLDGWSVEAVGSVEKGDLKAIITIHRSDRKFPFVHSVHYKECVQTRLIRETGEVVPNSVWEKQPIFMTKKVAIAQGFRLCFPKEMGGMPYTSDELPMPDVVEVKAEVVESKPKATTTKKSKVVSESEAIAEMQNAKSIDDMKAIWTKYQTFQKYEGFQKAKEQRKAELQQPKVEEVDDETLIEIAAAEAAAVAEMQED